MSKQRTNNAKLEAIADLINKRTGNPMKPWTRLDEDNGLEPNPGNYHIDYAYGGVQLCRMGKNGAGTSDVFGTGHIAKGKLADLMHAFLVGREHADADRSKS